MKEADQDLAELKKKHEEEQLAEIIKKEEEEATDRVRKKQLMFQRKKAQRGADDRLILEMQREERRLRVENDDRVLKNDWEQFWIHETEVSQRRLRRRHRHDFHNNDDADYN